MAEHVCIWAKTLEEARWKAKKVGLLKLETGRLVSKGTLENTYEFEKVER